MGRLVDSRDPLGGLTVYPFGWFSFEKFNVNSNRKESILCYFGVKKVTL